MEFELEYKLKLFREEQPDLFDKNNERYTATPIGKETGEMMLQLINELECALAKAETEIKQLTIPDVSVSLTDAEIITWLRKQNYQTEMGEQEYRMYFDVDMPKIIRAAITHFSSGNER